MGASIKIGAKTLFFIPYPSFVQDIFGIFRTIGRFIWLPCYIVFFASIYIVSKYINKKTANVVIIMCLILQIIDFYPIMQSKFKYEDKVYDINETAWKEVLEDAEHVVYLNVGGLSFQEERDGFYKVRIYCI